MEKFLCDFFVRLVHLSASSIHFQFQHRNTALILASQYSHHGIVEELLLANADTDRQNEVNPQNAPTICKDSRVLPLHYMSYSNHLRTLIILLKLFTGLEFYFICFEYFVPCVSFTLVAMFNSCAVWLHSTHRSV
jgi:hypothetical protein